MTAFHPQPLSAMSALWHSADDRLRPITDLDGFMVPSGMAADVPYQELLDFIVELLNRVAAPGRRPITLATELYYDLGLAGDDLYEAIAAIHARFHTDFRAMNLRAYAPGEAEGLFSFDLLRDLVGRPRRYRSLTVQLLVEAVQAGAW